MIVVLIKSAVAFFFLFFLHGTSIGTRQQGISYNVRPALRRQGLGFQMLNIRTMPNSITGVEFITTALLLQNWLLYAVFISSQNFNF